MSRNNNDQTLIKIQHDDNMSIYLEGGCNSVVLTSKDGEKALVVDTKYFNGAKELRAEVKQKNITIINTHFHTDHVRGNKLYPDAHVISGKTVWWQWDIDSSFSKRPDRILNPGEEIIVEFDQEKIHVLDLGQAHSLNDCVVYFEGRKLILTGDLVFNHIHPMVMGSNIHGWIEALKILEDKYEVSTLVPGHGAIMDKRGIFEMGAYFHSILEAAGDRRQIKSLKQQYDDYGKIPFLSGVEIVAHALQSESRRKQPSKK